MASRKVLINIASYRQSDTWPYTHQTSRESRHPHVMEHLKGKLEAVAGIHDVKVNCAIRKCKSELDPKIHDASAINRFFEDLDVIVGD